MWIGKRTGNTQMLQISLDEAGTIVMEGRLDAAQAPRAQEFLDRAAGRCVIDMERLEYISSAGLGVLLRTHKRLMNAGGGLKLINVNRHINDIFSYSGFDRLFEIEPAAGGAGR
jgi:anti-sigma B factor antagonist